MQPRKTDSEQTVLKTGARESARPCDQPASPTIEEVCEEFLAVQRKRLTPRTLSRYEDVLRLLRHYLDGYAYQGLSTGESALFDRYYNAEGKEHREFCQLLGPEKIVENLGGFLGYCMIRKVMVSEDLKRATGAVTKKLLTWLAAKAYVTEQQAREGADKTTDAARALPQAERAAQILYDAAADLGVNPNDLSDEDYLVFDPFTIAKVEAGTLWLETVEGAETRSYGPIPVPAAATKLLRKGWDISCSLGRVRGTWRIVGVASVYPTV